MWHLVLKQNEKGEMILMDGDTNEVLYRHHRWTKVMRFLMALILK
jgi:hypothetical protein